MDRLEELVHLSIGRAAMCWSEIPGGVFNDEYAHKIAQELLAAFSKHEQEAIERERMQHGTANAVPVALLKGRKSE